MTGVTVEGVEVRTSGHMEMILRNSCGVKFMEVEHYFLKFRIGWLMGPGLWWSRGIYRGDFLSFERLRRERNGVCFGGKSGKMEGSWARKCGEMIMVMPGEAVGFGIRKWGGFQVGEGMEKGVFHCVELHG
ncbi:hypothetical protein OIU85_000589 [Salix viminalis]|uniref:Uncharacterized protein n=2 Tax=Salix TaxID=40685 RepID=A0A9Q0VLZ6_SALVM|nr:hypothetical protein OIU85_000589 [Salix viminalis]